MQCLNTLIPGGNKKVKYLNKPAAESFWLPTVIKDLILSVALPKLFHTKPNYLIWSVNFPSELENI